MLDQTVLNLYWTQAHPPITRPPAVIPPAAEPFSYAEIRGGAVRSDWLTIDDGGVTYEAVNIVWPQAKIDQFVADNAADIFAVYGWTQGSGLDNDGTNPGDYATDPQGFLNIMPNHLNGDPPTFTNPNERTRFAGQIERQFAGPFSLNFSKGFN